MDETSAVQKCGFVFCLVSLQLDVKGKYLRLLAADYVSFERTLRHIPAQIVTFSLNRKGLQSSRLQLQQRVPFARSDTALRDVRALSPVLHHSQLHEAGPHISKEKTLLLSISNAGDTVLKQPKGNLCTHASEHYYMVALQAAPLTFIRLRPQPLIDGVK
jgi:hypothetical protein